MTTKFKNNFSTRLLLAINILTIIFLVLILLKEDYPKKFLNKFKSANSEVTIKNKVVTMDDLSVMNNTFQPKFKDYVNGKGNQLFKILIIGNSLTSHQIAENIGWSHESGMAASNVNKDYAHLLLAKISEKLPNQKIKMRVTNFADFERNPNILLKNKIDSLIHFKPDIVLFQLGENINENDIMLFQKKYVELINYFKKNDKIITICSTPFFPSINKNKMVNIVTTATNSFLVDLSHLTLLDDENYAKNEKEYQGDKTKWKVNGIGKHPGDKGMKSIADEIFITINAMISQNQ